MTEYTTLVTAREDDDTALIEALCAHRRRRPRDGQVYRYDFETDTFVAVPSRSFCVSAEVEDQ